MGAKWPDSELLPDVRRDVFFSLIETRLTRTTSARGGERRAQGRESRQRQELEKDKGRFRGWEGRMGLLAGASFVDESERRWGAGGEPQGRTRGLLERLGAGSG